MLETDHDSAFPQENDNMKTLADTKTHSLHVKDEGQNVITLWPLVNKNIILLI